MCLICGLHNNDNNNNKKKKKIVVYSSRRRPTVNLGFVVLPSPAGRLHAFAMDVALLLKSSFRNLSSFQITDLVQACDSHTCKLHNAEYADEVCPNGGLEIFFFFLVIFSLVIIYSMLIITPVEIIHHERTCHHPLRCFYLCVCSSQSVLVCWA